MPHHTKYWPLRFSALGMSCFALSACGMSLVGAPEKGFGATLPPADAARLAASAPAQSAAFPAAPVGAASQLTAVASKGANGAIFQSNGGYSPLYYGQRAHQVGDVLNVVLVESISSNKSVSSDTKRSGNFGITPPSAGPFSFNPNALNSGASSSFKGAGNASQASNVGGEISVTIADVRSNGTALVKGEKLMKLSQGEEWVQFSGIVRLSDISPENRVASTQVADARIVYSGQGSVQRAGREGWLSKFFNFVSPF